jgi:small lipoprotein (TIGR04452 family)
MITRFSPNPILQTTFLFIFTFFSCMGFDGPNVIKGDEVMNRIRKAVDAKITGCRVNESTSIKYPELGGIFQLNQRVYYETQDADRCVDQIEAATCQFLSTKVIETITNLDILLITACSKIQPKAIATPPYFQGDFL